MDKSIYLEMEEQDNIIHLSIGNNVKCKTRFWQSKTKNKMLVNCPRCNKLILEEEDGTIKE